ncbi:hypothetical protein [Microbacterium sp. CR_7]|uniref:hypothetical protein n=1 Tax=Microbacterium sp. CR_7 TaxID=3055792 RepID=UPI0035C20339
MEATAQILHVPRAVMLQHVVASAQRRQIVGRGIPAQRMVPDVIEIAVSGGEAAAGETASLISSAHEALQVG